MNINPFTQSAKHGFPNKGALANSVDPDQMLQNVTSDHGLHCFH